MYLTNVKLALVSNFIYTQANYIHFKKMLFNRESSKNPEAELAIESTAKDTSLHS